MTPRRFPAPWTAIETPGGYQISDASGTPLAYVYGREVPSDGMPLTKDESRRIAAAIARLPELLARET